MKDIETPTKVSTAYVQQSSPTSISNPPNKTVVPLHSFSHDPMNILQCPICGNQTRTRTISSPNMITWIACAVMFFLFWPLCWVPLVVDSCKITTHYCKVCNGQIGTAKPFQGCCVSYKE
ncbi:hypothetical protein CTEN210_05922 [Chaetoceros tenuissimus]|uniref:LITAF domain-containing protein n=1 Tax=Chaetoceros tenuissimus TaxID=426638 RepID=A0AAD3CQT5_9STRA|nr:hypothetical protein CTEN210_05922 [Chaetoceros tenuissimus]